MTAAAAIRALLDDRGADPAPPPEVGDNARGLGRHGELIDRLDRALATDLPVLTRCGLACAPREAPQAVRQRVHYVCQSPAGAGAVREICELLMRAQGSLDAALARYLA